MRLNETENVNKQQADFEFQELRKLRGRYQNGKTGCHDRKKRHSWFVLNVGLSIFQYDLSYWYSLFVIAKSPTDAMAAAQASSSPNFS